MPVFNDEKPGKSQRKPSPSKIERTPSEKLKRASKKHKKEKTEKLDKTEKPEGTSRRGTRDFSILTTLAAFMTREKKQKIKSESATQSPTPNASETETSLDGNVVPVAEDKAITETNPGAKTDNTTQTVSEPSLAQPTEVHPSKAAKDMGTTLDTSVLVAVIQTMDALQEARDKMVQDVSVSGDDMRVTPSVQPRNLHDGSDKSLPVTTIPNDTELHAAPTKSETQPGEKSLGRTNRKNTHLTLALVSPKKGQNGKTYLEITPSIRPAPLPQSFESQAVQTESDINSTSNSKSDESEFNHINSRSPEISMQPSARATSPIRPVAKVSLLSRRPNSAQTVKSDTSGRSGSSSDNSLASVSHADGEKCQKCRIFELMFSSGNEDILNDAEILNLFRKHMNTHLRKARQDLDNLYKLPREKGIPASKYINDNQLRSNVKDSGTPANPRRDKRPMVDKSTVTTSKPGIFSSKHKKSRDFSQQRSSVRKELSEALKEILASANSASSEEVIIRKKNCFYDNHNNRQFCVSEDDNDYDDSQHSCKCGRHHGFGNQESYSNPRSQNCRSCPRVKSIPVIICDTNDEDYCEEYSLNLDEMKYLAENGTGPESKSNLEWFIKGMIAGLNGHLNPEETNEMIRELSQNDGHRKSMESENTPGREKVSELNKGKMSKAYEKLAGNDKNNKSEGNGKDASILSSISRKFTIKADETGKNGKASDKKLENGTEIGSKREGESATKQNLDLTESEVQELVEDIVDALSKEMAGQREKDGNEKIDRGCGCDTFFSLDCPTIKVRKRPFSSGNKKDQNRINTGHKACSGFCPLDSPIIVSGSSCNVTNWCYSKPGRTCQCFCSQRQTPNCGNIRYPCWMPYQEACKANSPLQYGRAKPSAECAANCSKREKEKAQQRKQMQSLLNALNSQNYSQGCTPRQRHTDCSSGCKNLGQGQIEPFTYVVPQSHMYCWQMDDADK